jgi:hypothetical protein
MITIDELIKRDLYRDYRTYTDHDDSDWPSTFEPPVEISPCNRKEFEKHFDSIKERCTSILEIGVCRNDEESLSHILINQKKEDAFYFGVDIKDKTFLDNEDKNVFTIQSDSADIDKIMTFVKSKGVDHFDFIFIDGWHSINQVLKEWRFVEYLSDFGIIALHDTNFHPGPTELVNNLKAERYEVYKKCEQNTDWGITFVTKKL